MNFIDFSKNTKKCWQCKKALPISLFAIDKKNKTGMSCKCAECLVKTKEHKRIRIGKYRQDKADHFNAKRRENYSRLSNQEKKLLNNMSKIYQLENKVKIKKQRRSYRQNNKESINDRNKKYNSSKRAVDPMFKLRCSARERLVKYFGKHKSSSTKELLGCSFEDLKIHLELQFQPEMKWDNYGFGQDKWNVDHVIPLAKASNEEELKALCHYSNLQPLWQIDNILKGAS